jgi:hypothetical protein
MFRCRKPPESSLADCGYMWHRVFDRRSKRERIAQTDIESADNRRDRLKFGWRVAFG